MDNRITCSQVEVISSTFVFFVTYLPHRKCFGFTTTFVASKKKNIAAVNGKVQHRGEKKRGNVNKMVFSGNPQ